uniref:Uncharacterized protein n=1 Tax=Anguilla anguilla TaxID=7936 RepID=A0A0E9TYE7_ANGAN
MHTCGLCLYFYVSVCVPKAGQLDFMWLTHIPKKTLLI